MLNDLGSVPRMELHILAKMVMESQIAPRVTLFVGPAPFHTALNTNGFSLSVLPLEGRRREWLMAPTECRGWVEAVVPTMSVSRVQMPINDGTGEQPEPSHHPTVSRLLHQVADALIEAEEELVNLSAVTGTGKLGMAVSRFARQLLAAIPTLPMACPRKLFRALADMCCDFSGVLFTLAKVIFTTASRNLAVDDSWNFRAVVRAVTRGAHEAQMLAGVGSNRRTLLDALLPALSARVEDSEGHESTPWERWLIQAAAEARRGARSTANMVHATDRAMHTPLAQRSGVPDGGAVTVATMFTALATPQEGMFRRLPQGEPGGFEDEVSLTPEDAEAKAEERATQEFASYYQMSQKVLGTGHFRRVRVGVAMQGEKKGMDVAISERRNDELEELGVRGFRNSYVMDRRQMLNWLFRPKNNVVEVLEVILTPKRYFYVMEFLRGRSLLDLIYSKEVQSNERIARISREMLLAVSELHRSRLVHGDLKPDTFRFDSSGQLKLVDVFGMLSHASESYEQEFKETTVGTLSYMSPEALSGCGRQPSDIWAVGVTIYQLVSGKLPFTASSIEEAIDACRTPFDYSGGQWTTLPEVGKELVGRLLEVNAFNRITAEQALVHPFVCVTANEFMQGRRSTSLSVDISGDNDSMAGAGPESPQTTRQRLKRWTITPAVEDKVPPLVDEGVGSATKTIYFIRHGEATHNIEEKATARRAAEAAISRGIQPGSPEFVDLLEEERKKVLQNPAFYDASLSPKGKLEALRCKCELDGLLSRGMPKPTMVFTSPLDRTLETAASIFPYHSNVQAWEDLRERRTGLPCDSKKKASVQAHRLEYQAIDFAHVEEDESDVLEDKTQVRERAKKFLESLPANSAASDENHNVYYHTAICIVGHKGYLREMERGVLGHPGAPEFSNCEMRVYELTWSRSGSLDLPARCLYTNTKLCTLHMRNFPESWLVKVNELPARIWKLLQEFGDLKVAPTVQEGTPGPIVNAVFVDQSAAAAAARRLHGLDIRTEAERTANPTSHEADRFWARILYDVEEQEMPCRTTRKPRSRRKSLVTPN
eukprot:TRINITY_DN49685_c0_g1_i1.p1 TRINITY_DN49685_c0_g1~~TRINITY_DN49685_c0_g1_i1.p1  ORF type:complete len:1223 (+),score=226.83 TRINITY_DN49685_c0_g1_i1:508-3669(+)